MPNTTRAPAPTVRRLAARPATRRSADTTRPINLPNRPETGPPAFHQPTPNSLSHRQNETNETARNRTEQTLPSPSISSPFPLAGGRACPEPCPELVEWIAVGLEPAPHLMRGWGCRPKARLVSSTLNSYDRSLCQITGCAQNRHSPDQPAPAPRKKRHPPAPSVPWPCLIQPHARPTTSTHLRKFFPRIRPHSAISPPVLKHPHVRAIRAHGRAGLQTRPRESAIPSPKTGRGLEPVPYSIRGWG